MKGRIAIKIFRKIRLEPVLYPGYNIGQLKRAAHRLFGGKGVFNDSQEAESFYTSFADSLINYDPFPSQGSWRIMKGFIKKSNWKDLGLNI